MGCIGPYGSVHMETCINSNGKGVVINWVLCPIVMATAMATTTTLKSKCHWVAVWKSLNVKELRIHEKTMSFLITICETYRDTVWRLLVTIFSQCSIPLCILFSLTSYSVYNYSYQLNRFWAAFTKKKHKWFPAGHTRSKILKDFIKELSPFSINIALRFMTVTLHEASLLTKKRSLV